MKALQGVTARAEKAEESLHHAASSISWKWAAIWVATSCMLLVPSPNEISNLRASAAALEAKGGKVNLTLCGPQKRLCAEIGTKAEAWGENSQFRILKGY